MSGFEQDCARNYARGETRRVKFSVFPDNQLRSYPEEVRRARLWEEAGFDVVWTGDHVLPFQHHRGHNRSAIVQMVEYLCTGY